VGSSPTDSIMDKNKGKVRRLYDTSQRHLQDTVKHYGDLIRLMKKVSNLQSLKILQLQAENNDLRKRLSVYEVIENGHKRS
jgi:ferritin-like protein